MRLVAAGVAHVVVTCPEREHDAFGAALHGLPVRCVSGGPTRQASVSRGLDALAEHPGDTPVMVHDAARPLASAALMGRLLDAIREGAAAALPGLPVADTIKRVVDDVVEQTLDRRELVAVQTPQVFLLETLREAHDAGAHLAGDEQVALSDDAGLVERFTGVRVRVVMGEDRAMKITTATDLALAEAMVTSGRWT